MKGLKEVESWEKVLLGAGTLWTPGMAVAAEIDSAAGWDHLWLEVLIDISVIGAVFSLAAIWMLFRYRARSPNDVGRGPKLSSTQAVA
ncbi:MAG: Cytochrome c oxidase aa3 subunit II [Rhodospirillaceae bacterium]|nr:MAG: Cytochrome c oxidase aa3 subunit II [Rhodospirillaceae bacterium]